MSDSGSDFVPLFEEKVGQEFQGFFFRLSVGKGMSPRSNMFL